MFVDAKDIFGFFEALFGNFSFVIIGNSPLRLYIKRYSDRFDGSAVVVFMSF